MLAPIVENAEPVGKEKKSRLCETCGKSYATRKSLLQHRMNVHGEGGGYTCGPCQRKFSDKEKWLDHLSAAHHGVARHKCPGCKETFKYERNLRAHLVKSCKKR